MRLNRIKSALKSVIAIVIAVAYLLPLVWLIMCSFKNNDVIFKLPPRVIFSPILDNYRYILRDGQYTLALSNSMGMSICTAIVTVLLGSIAAYALVRGPFRKKGSIKYFVITTRMAPPLGFVISYFVIFKFLGVLGNRFTLFLVYLNMNLGFAIWLMLGFFDQIPVSIEESAMLDGCSRMRSFLRIACPLARPGLAATAIFTFIMCWNEFPYALLLTNLRTMTLPVIIPNYLGVIRLEWGHLAAAGILTALPVVIFAILIQKHLVKGLTFGAY